ncbi:hypothetical protein BDN72DRAFT_895064 [Pluteus cervinus]|uniref:Uncharacterized protein n=1 Tax=Pluteus cervinus TaxID=181527 RepID=A0ACD3B218_9AGAR|nr:hypothetical protein BDN72DRAFT_895064 [Pluteus cervinus]
MHEYMNIGPMAELMVTGSVAATHAGSSAVFEETLLDQYTDEQILEFIEGSPYMITTREERILTLSPNVVVKPFTSLAAFSDEIAALDCAKKAGIRVPNVRRAVQRARPENSFLLLGRVHGFTLEQLWAQLGWWTTFRIAWQLPRSFLRTMMLMTSQKMGGLQTGVTHSKYFQGSFLPIPHMSTSAFAAHINWWITDCALRWRMKPRPDLTIEPPDQFVFVHQDLAPRNMILDNSGELWIVDWGNAGFYPRYMEYMGIELTSHTMPWAFRRTWSARLARLRWSFFRWIAYGGLGKYEKHSEALQIVRGISMRHPREQAPFSAL